MNPELEFFEVKSVLLVEDSSSSAMLVKSVFSSLPENMGFAEITHVETLAEASKLVSDPASSSKFDVVLLDLTLPDGVGLETLSKFQEICPDIAIVVLTGSNDEKLGMQAIAMGAHNFLFKDETYPKLLIRQTNYAHHRFQYEKLLNVAKQQAEMATALKDKYIALVSHDLRNPLGNIISSLGVTTSDSPDFDLTQKQEFAHLAMNSAKHLLGMVEDLLDVSRLQQGFITPERVFNNAYYVVNEVISRLQFLANEKKVEVKNEVNKETRIYADKTLFSQLIQNLLSNAIKFSHKDSIVRIYSVGDDPISLVVEDYGVGIENEKIDQLTSLDQRTSTVGTAGEKGSGIGIPHCNEIMLCHGGELSIKSKVGEKTVVNAKFPKVKPRVLIVDDDSSIVNFIKVLLSKLDVDMVVANNGKNAFSELQKIDKPDLMLLDVVLPDTDGITILQKMKQDPQFSSIPVIVITGDDKIGTREVALGIGANDFVSKPVKEEDLIPRIHRIIG